MSSARTRATRRASDGSEPGRVVKEVESRLRPLPRAGNRARAREIHREADQLYYRGDFESALVLYHRAARLCPRENIHVVAARRTEGAISSQAKPPRELLYGKRAPPALSTTPSSSKMTKTASRKARNQLTQSTDTLLDACKDLDLIDSSERALWPQEPVARGASSTSLRASNKSSRMLRQLDRCVRATYRELEAAYGSGDAESVHKLGDELVNLVSLSEEPRHNQVEAYRYLAMKHVALGRHDRAVELVSKMIFLAKSGKNDVELVVKALATLGKVHLSFGHVSALVREWERLVDDVKSEPMAQAWLYHEIGRCHLQLGHLEPALHAANLSLERTTSCPNNSTCKWLLRSELLRGETLIRLGRPYQALDALQSAEAAADPQREPPKLVEHVRNLVKKLTRMLGETSSKDSPLVEPIDLSVLRTAKVDKEKLPQQQEGERSLIGSSQSEDEPCGSSTSSSSSKSSSDEGKDVDETAAVPVEQPPEIVAAEFGEDIQFSMNNARQGPRDPINQNCNFPRSPSSSSKRDAIITSAGGGDPNSSITSEQQPPRKRRIEDSQVARILQRTKELGRLLNSSSVAGDHLALDEDKSSDEGARQDEQQPDTARTRIISRLQPSESEDERTLRPDELVPLDDPTTLESHRSDDDGEEAGDDIGGSESDERDEESLTSDRGGAASFWSAALAMVDSASILERLQRRGRRETSSHFSPEDILTSPSVVAGFSQTAHSDTRTSGSSSSGRSDRSSAEVNRSRSNSCESLRQTDSSKSLLTDYLRGLRSRDFEELRREESDFFATRSGSE